jgi:hypothetical protein
MKLAFLLIYAGAARAHPSHGQPELRWKVLRKP